MDPITLGIGAIGLGLQIFGGMGAADEAKKQADLSQKNFGLEKDVNAQRMQAMELSASRQKLENYRNTQRVRAAGLNAAVAQGAQFGSGAAGGQAQATSQGAFNALGVDQNLSIGRNIFGLNNKISDNKALISQSQASQASDQALSNLGGSLTKGAGTISNIASFGQTQFNNLFPSSGGGDFSTGGVPYSQRLTGGIGSA